jgi:hypothetical protein
MKGQFARRGLMNPDLAEIPFIEEGFIWEDLVVFDGLIDGFGGSIPSREFHTPEGTKVITQRCRGQPGEDCIRVFFHCGNGSRYS